jgi:hypothetical protein
VQQVRQEEIGTGYQAIHVLVLVNYSISIFFSGEERERIGGLKSLFNLNAKAS